MKNENYLIEENFYLNVEPIYMAPDEEESTEGDDGDESIKPAGDVPNEKQ